MADIKLGTAYVDLEISEAQALSRAQQTGAKIAAMLNGTIATALGRNDPLAAFDKHASKERLLRIKLDARQAEQELKRLEREQNNLERKEAYKLRVDTSQAQQAIRASVAGLEQYQKIMGDIAARKIGANISMAGSIGRDTRELQRQLETVKEIERHRAALSKASKLKIDDADLQKIKRELHELHTSNNKAIKIKYDNSGLNDLRESLNKTLESVARGAAASIGGRIVGGITSAVRGLGDLAGGAIGGSLDIFKDFDATITDFGLKAEATDEQVKKFKKTIADMSTTRSATELAAAGVEMAKLGFTADQTSDSLKSITNMADATGLKDLGKAATITATGMQVFQKSANEVNDVITTLSNKSSIDPSDFMQGFAKDGALFQSTGQSIQELARLMGALKDSGFQAQEAAGAIKTSLIQLTAPSDRGQAAMDKLGLRVYDAAGKMKPMVSILADMKTKMKGLSDEQRLPLLNDILGRRGGAAGAAVMNYLGTDKDKALKSALDDSEGSSEKGASLKGKGFAGSINRLKKELQDIQIQFGEALGGVIAKIADMIGQVSQKLEGAGIFDKLAEGAKTFSDYLEKNPQIIDQIATAIGQLATEGFTFITDQVKLFTETLEKNPQLIQETLDRTVELIDDLAQLAVFSLEFGKGFAETAIFITGILSPLGEMVGALTGSKDSSASLAENLGKAAGWMVVLGGFASVLGTFVSIGKSVASIVGWCGGWAAVVTKVQGAVTAVGAVLGGTVAAAVGTIALGLGAIAITVYNIVQYASNWGDVCLGVQQTLTDIDNWVKSIIGESKILNGIWDVIKAALSYLVNPLGEIYKWIDQSVQQSGLFKDQWNGLKATFEAVGGWIQNSVIGPIIAAKDALAGLLGMGGNSGNNNAGGGVSSTIAGVELPAEIAAFIEMVRVGEGTVGEKGFTTMFTGKQFSDFSDHPRQLQSGGGFTSDAAGMGQFLSTTWDGVKDKIGAKDFSPANQVKGIVQLIKDRGAYDDLMRGDLNAALGKLSAEWASLPTGVNATGGMHGQPAKTGSEAKRLYDELLAKMRSGGVSSGGGGSLSGKTNTFKDVVVTSAIDSDGQPGMDYVTEANNGNGGRGAWAPSLTAGKVIEIRNDNRELTDGSGEQGYGNVAIVRTLDEKSGEFVDLLYAHFDQLAVKVGDEVAVGTVLGTQGRTGSTTGAHTSVDFYGKDSNQPTSASLAMRDRLAQDLASGAGGLNGRVGQRQLVIKTENGYSAATSGQSSSPINQLTVPGGSRPDIKTKSQERVEDAAEKAAKQKLRDAELLTKKQQKEEAERLKALEEARRYQDSETKARRESAKKNRDLGRKQELAEIEKQSVGITDPDLKKQIDFRKSLLTTGASSSDRIADLKDELTDLLSGLKRKQADMKAGGDVADKAKLLPNYSKAIAETKALIAQEEKYRDTILGVSNAENNATLAADKLALARQQRDSGRAKDYEVKKADAERTKAVLSESGLPTDKASNKLEEIELTYKATEALQKLIDKREDAQRELALYQKTLGKGKTDETVALKKGAIGELDKEIAALKKKYADDGIVLNLKVAADNRKEAIEERDRVLKFDNEDRLMQLRGELELQKQANDQYAALTEIEIDRVQTLYDINGQLNAQNDELAKANDVMAALQANGALIDSEEMKSAEKLLDGINQNIAQLTDKKNREIKLFDIKNAKEAQEIAERMMNIRAEQQGVQFEATSKQRRSAIEQRRDKYGRYDSKASNDEKALFADERDQKLKAGAAGIVKDTADLAAKGYKRTAQEIRNLNKAMSEGVENEYLENLKKIPSVGREIATSLGDGVTGAIKGLILEGKSLGETLSNLFSNLASQLLDIGLGGLFGGGGLGGLFGSIFGGSGGKKSGGGLFSGVLGGSGAIAYEGGVIPNYAQGNGVLSGLTQALDKERSMSGLQPKIGVFNVGEAIIDAQTTKKLQAALSRPTMNFAMGNAAGHSIANGVRNNSSGITVNVGGVSVSSNNPNVDQKAIQQSVNVAITDKLLREQRPGGILA